MIGMASSGSQLSSLYDAYIFDLDGTVCLGDTLLPGAQWAITRLRAAGRRTLFLSNNPTRRQHENAARLARLGLPTPPEEIVTSSVVMVEFLARVLPSARLFVVGEEPLQADLRLAGFTFTREPSQIEAVIASFDRTFAYWKLQTAFDAIRAGARFFATHADRFCPVPGGGQPDAASVIAAIEACTGVEVEAVVGKPSPYMVDAVLSRLRLPPERCLIIGDRLETDVQMGLQAGMDSVLTLTGATSVADAADSSIKPTYVVSNLGELLPE